MKIVFVIEDIRDSVNIQVMRFDGGPSKDLDKQTPANLVAQTIEHLLKKPLADDPAAKSRSESCLH